MKYRIKKTLHLWEASGGGNIFRRAQVVNVLKDIGSFALGVGYSGKEDFDRYIKSEVWGYYPIPNSLDFDKYFMTLASQKPI